MRFASSLLRTSKRLRMMPEDVLYFKHYGRRNENDVSNNDIGDEGP